MGWSESPASSAEYALGPHAERTFQALSRLGVRDPIIVGHSYGGAVALQLAADHPTFPAAVVHLCGVGPDLIGSAPWHRHALLVRAGLVLEVPVLGHVMSGWIIPAFLGVVDPTLWMRGQFAGDWDDVPAAYIDRHVRGLQMPRQLRNARREAAWLPADLDALAGRLSSVRAPVVVVSCEDDNMVPVSVGDALVAELPRTTRVVLPQAGHNVHVSRPDDVVDIVEQAILLADAPDTD
jgi:pimeloyl-ACP methyl ester carboxylesterase